MWEEDGADDGDELAEKVNCPSCKMAVRPVHSHWVWKVGTPVGYAFVAALIGLGAWTGPGMVLVLPLVLMAGMGASAMHRQATKSSRCPQCNEAFPRVHAGRWAFGQTRHLASVP